MKKIGPISGTALGIIAGCLLLPPAMAPVAKADEAAGISARADDGQIGKKAPKWYPKKKHWGKKKKKDC